MISGTDRLLIFGCGFLGARVATLWRSLGGVVYATTRHPQRASPWRAQGIEPIIADVMQPATLARLPEVTHVLYSVGYDRHAPHSKEAVYVQGLTHVLHSLPKSVVRLVSISSSSVYGQDDGSWVDESSPTAPESDGGRICLAAEEALHQWHPNSTILRMSGLYGPERLLARIAQLKSGEPLAGQPDAWLNLIHGDDAARACLAALTAPTPGPLYLVSDDRPLRRHEYFTELAKRVGAPVPTFTGTPTSRHSAVGLNKRCRNTLAKRELQLDWQYPDVTLGLASVPLDSGAEFPT